jgi:uncharacterized membrane protein
MLGGVFALLAAASFGFNNAAIRRGVLSGSVFQALAITVPMGVPLFLLAGIASGHIDKLWEFPAEAYFWLAAAGVMHFVWGRYCNYRSTKAIGGNLSGPWKQSQLIVALILAIVLLGETLSPLKILGIVLIVRCVSHKPRQTQEKAQDKCQRRRQFRGFGKTEAGKTAGLRTKLCRGLHLRTAIRDRLWHQSGAGPHGSGKSRAGL